MSLSRRILYLFNNMKIRKKLIYIFLIVVLIPVLFVGIYLTNSMRNMVMEQAVREASINTDRIEDRLREVLKKATEVSDGFYVDKQLQKIVMTEYKSTLQVVDDYLNYNAFDEYLRFYKEFSSIRFYVNNKTLLDNSRFMKVTNEIQNSDWYKDAVKNDGRISWSYEYDNIVGQKYLNLIRFLKSEQKDKLGVLVISINSDYLYSIIKDEPYETVVMLDNESVVIAADTSMEGVKSDIINMKALDVNTHNATIETVYKGKKSILIVNSFLPEKTSNRFAVVSIIPVDNIVSKANQVSLMGLAIIGISLVVAISMILYFSELFSQRIIMLRKEMHKVVTGDFNISARIEGKDEVGELYDDLKIMIDSIQQLIHKVYEERIQKEQLNNRQREVELKMLASQINPHFLYNTLETIRMKAHSSKQTEIAHIVKMLGKLMRRNLEVSDKLVELESEIELVKSYLEIQRFRFGERISYDINISLDITGYKILPLLLQPIVENAFVHGLESKKGKGSITINIEQKDNYMAISVIDDGVGIDGAELEELNKKINNFTQSGKKSIGLSNINQRIKLFYGGNYYMKLISQKDKGTRVDLYLPANKEEVPNVQDIDS